MQVNIKKTHKNSIIPSYALEGDAGLDLTAVSMEYDPAGNTSYDTGLVFEIPSGYVGLLFPRSSISKTKDMSLRNSVGVIDSNFRGSVKMKFSGLSDYKPGDRIGQIIILPYPHITFEEVNELTQTVRNGGEFGSTGK
jgi:dUTP pyrophosphatase